MAIRSDSYGSVADVTAYTRHLLDGQSAFNSTTRPTVTEVEGFIDRASGVLNNCILGAGFSPSDISSNSTAVLALDEWVVTRAARMVELTQRGTGYDGSEGSRLAGFDSMIDEACEYVSKMTAGWKEQGITVSKPTSEGLEFTGLDEHDQRADPDDSTREQPKFRRGKFDIYRATDTEDDD